MKQIIKWLKNIPDKIFGVIIFMLLFPLILTAIHEDKHYWKCHYCNGWNYDSKLKCEFCYAPKIHLPFSKVR